MKSLPIGVQDFKSVRKTDKYFVDKSMLIGQILDQNDCGVFLYTRPRRFGKSLNLSMLDAFFNIKYHIIYITKSKQQLDLFAVTTYNCCVTKS